MYQTDSKIISFFIFLSCLKSLQRLLFSRVFRNATLKDPGKISKKVLLVRSAFTKNESYTFPELFFRGTEAATRGVL